MKIKIKENKVFQDIIRFFESSNINFLLGSGCSIDSIPSLGNLEKDITDLINKYSVSRDEEIKEKICKLLNNFILSASVPTDKLLKEEYLEGEKVELTKNKYMDFLKVIYLILLNRGSNLLPKKVNIFTTNYDLFLESAAEELKIPYNDGGIGVFNRFFSSKNYQRKIIKLSDSYSYEYEEPNINIIKLHGSLNWKLIDDENTLLVSNNIECDLLETTNIEDNGFINKNTKIPIIFPTKQKFIRTLMEHTYYDLSRLFANELEREQSLLICSGFSFEDEHIRAITQRSLSNPFLTLYLLPYSYVTEQKVLDYFETFPNVKVIRIMSQEIETNDTDNQKGVQEYSILFASKDMTEERRINIDFTVLISILNQVLDKVAERKVF